MSDDVLQREPGEQLVSQPKIYPRYTGPTEGYWARETPLEREIRYSGLGPLLAQATLAMLTEKATDPKDGNGCR